MGTYCCVCDNKLIGAFTPKNKCECRYNDNCKDDIGTGGEYCYGCWKHLFDPKQVEVFEALHVRQADGTFVPFETRVFKLVPVTELPCETCGTLYTVKDVDDY